MAKEILACGPDATLIEAEEIMRSAQVRRLPVIDSDGALVGIVSLNDLALLAEHEIGRKNRDLSAQEVTATLAAICAPRQQTASLATRPRPLIEQTGYKRATP